ncbi:MAG: HEAT repeat domain-containing protein [Nostoc sp.]|uniref:HEAT repeat domain-containing protein n=1 Tax=Nostoc sp. TaxID=1180 RepID=UPI002FFA47CC
MDTFESLEEQILSHILQAITEDNPDIKRQAAEALCYMSSKQQIEPLTQLLNSNIEESVQMAAIEALGAIGGNQIVEVLILVQSDGKPLVRWKLDEVLDKLLSGEKFVVPVSLPSIDNELVSIIN